nr:hypothetical protein GCM10020092_034000 [Actinoplanes digitatis]
MPVDIDELFTEFGRQADLLPLADASVPRRIGARRVRNRALVAATAAVLLVVAGLGAANWRRERHAEPVLPADTVRGLNPIGTPLHIYGPANKSMFAGIAAVGDRVYVASGSIDDTSEVIAVDGRTGRKIWSAGRMAGFETNGVIALPGVLLVAEGSALRILDPDTGKKLWATTDPPNGDVVVDERTLVRVNEASLTEGFDLRTGKKLWSAVPAGEADRPKHSAGVIPGTAEPARNVRSIQTSDGRLVQITLGGRVLFRDMRTGDVSRSVATTVRPKQLTGFAAYDGVAYIYDNTGYSDRPSRLLAVDAATGATRVVYSLQAGHLRSFFPCGTRQLCLSGDDNVRGDTLQSMDLASGQVGWSVAAPGPAFSGSARGWRVLVSGIGGTALYDLNGRVLFQAGANGSGGWIDDQNLLVLVPIPDTGGYRLVAVAARDGRQTTIGTLPRTAGGCSWTSEFLACRDGVELKLWAFVR